jgi:hypothetical protein
MNKTLKYSLLGLLVICLGISSYLIFAFPEQQSPVDQPDPNLPAGEIQQPLALGEAEYLSEEEKHSLNIDSTLRIQVLERDETGKISAYKIINSDEDIQSEYYPVESYSQISE